MSLEANVCIYSSARGDTPQQNNCWEESGGQPIQRAFPLLKVYTRAEYTAKLGDSTSLNEAYEGKRRKCSLESHGRPYVYIARTKRKEMRQGHIIVIINHVPSQQNVSYNL